MIQQEPIYPFDAAHFQLAMEAADVGMWDWDLVHNHMVWSEHHKMIFGQPMDAPTEYEDFMACLHPDDRERISNLVRESLAQKKEYNTEYRVLWPDESVHWVTGRGRGIYDAQGQAVRMIGVVLDITAQKQAEEWQHEVDRLTQETLEEARQQSEELVRQLATKQAFLQALMEQAPAGLVIAEVPSGELTFYNEEISRLLGFTYMKKDDYRRYVQPGMTHADGSPYGKNEYPLVRVLRTGEVVKQEAMRYQRADDSIVYLSVNAAPIRDEQGKMIAVVCSLHDVSERYELEKKKDEFISMASHELRTPLTAMKGNLQMAERRLKRLLHGEQDSLSEEQKGMAEDVAMRITRTLSQVKVQSRMIEDLLDVTRIQTGKLRLAMERCNLAEIINEVVADMRAVLPDRSITLELPDLPEIPIMADTMRIGQVVHNFLTNALKYSPETCPVAIGVALEEGGARVWVRDSGPGLSQEAQQRIWNRFQQEPGQKGGKGVDGGGLGLGLYISHALIQEHGGSVGVKSAPGEGSIFWFALPLASR